MRQRAKSWMARLQELKSERKPAPECEFCWRPVERGWLSDPDFAFSGLGEVLCNRADCIAERESASRQVRLNTYLGHSGR